MDFKHLQSYVAVVKYRNFTKAAQKTGVSQPSITAHIQQLENELETQLLIRTTKSIALTQCGEELYQYALNVLENRDRLLKRWNNETKNLIHLGVSTIPSAYILPEILPAFQHRFPQVRFIIHQSDSHGVAEGLLGGSFDVGIIGMNYRDNRVTCVPFCQDRMVLITPNSAEYAKMQSDGTPPQEIIAQYPVILREPGSGSQKKTDRIISAFGLEEESLQIIARLDDQEAIKNLVASGLGVSIVSERAVRKDMGSGRLLSFELPQELSQLSFYLMTINDSRLSKRTEDFCQFLLHYDETGGSW